MWACLTVYTIDSRYRRGWTAVGATAWALMGLLAASCVWELDWTPEGLPCKDGECAPGYSCFVGTCVGDGTVEAGGDCSASVQCGAGLVCVGFVCQQECSQYYNASSECGGQQFCKSFEAEGKISGRCVTSECDIDADCRGEGSRCVPITGQASACMLGCELSISDGAYSDACSTVSDPGYCQPVGASGQEHLVCLSTTADAQSRGAPCSPFNNPCQPGLACVSNLCRAYCDVDAAVDDNGCEAAEQCCPLQAEYAGEGNYGICKDACD